MVKNGIHTLYSTIFLESYFYYFFFVKQHFFCCLPLGIFFILSPLFSRFFSRHFTFISFKLLLPVCVRSICNVCFLPFTLCTVCNSIFNSLVLLERNHPKKLMHTYSQKKKNIFSLYHRATTTTTTTIYTFRENDDGNTLLRIHNHIRVLFFRQCAYIKVFPLIHI